MAIEQAEGVLIQTSSEAVKQASTNIDYTYITNYVGIASFTILLWDHIITFGDEVKYIWRGDRRKTLIVCLFLFNRYFIPLGFLFNILAYFDIYWKNQNRCQHFVRFEGAVTLIGLSTTALMMMIRVTALHKGNRTAISGLVGLFLIQLGVYTWLLTNGKAVQSPGIDVNALPPHVQDVLNRVEGCSMIFDGISSSASSASAWLPWLYDTVVIVLVVHKSLVIRRGPGGNIASTGVDLTRALIKDGLLYYSVIFAANCSLTIMIIQAPQGLQNLMAQFEVLITVTMMSRITISLRKHAKPDEDDWVHNKFNPKFLSSFQAVPGPIPPIGMIDDTKPDHHILHGPHRAPGETTFGTYSAHVKTYVPQEPSRPVTPHLPQRLKDSERQDPANEEVFSFGSDSAHAATYVPPPGTDIQVERDREREDSRPASGQPRLDRIRDRARVQFSSNISPPGTPGTRTPARTPLVRTPVQSFAEWTFGVGGPLRPSAWRSHHPESGWDDWTQSDQSLYSQELEAVDTENIELESTKYGGVIEHVERV